MNVLLLSTYDLGRQPFGLASPAAWLGAEGFDVRCRDLAVDRLDESEVAEADVVAFHLPMHTAARITAALVPRVRELNPGATLCAYGLYASVAAERLGSLGVKAFFAGEFERDLVRFVTEVAGEERVDEPAPIVVSHDRLEFAPPVRSRLPALDRYAGLRQPDGTERIVGATEASRGCKHRCRHCPVVPVYDGRFRVVQTDVVLADIESQVVAGADHVTFGDPDFFNGPGHAIEVVRRLHARFPEVTYDVTIKVEHLLTHAEHLPLLRETGCVLITSAVESIDDRVLEILDKGHTRADFERALALCREHELALQPTFVAFHPWIELPGYLELLDVLVDLDLVGHVAPIQLALRLLIPPGSRLLELAEVRDLVGPVDAEELVHPWSHADPRVDALQRQVEELVALRSRQAAPRGEVFREIRALASAAATGDPDAGRAAGVAGDPATVANEAGRAPPLRALPDRATIPFLTEPWYC